MLRNTTSTPDIDLSGNYELTYLLVDDYYNIYLISNGNEYTNITSAAFAKFYDSKLDISNNYDGTYTINNIPTLESGHNIMLDDGSTPTVIASPYTFIATVDVSYNAYVNDVTPYENTRSTDIMLKYDTDITTTNNYDGTYTVTDISLYGSDVFRIHRLDNDTIIDFVDNTLTFTPIIDVSYNVSVYDGNNKYTNVTSTNIVEYYDTKLVVTNNYDGTFTLSNPPDLHGSDKLMLRNLDVSDVVIPDVDITDNYTLTALDVNDNYDVYLLSNTNEYANLTSEPFVRFYDSRLTIVNNYEGSYDISSVPIIDISDNIRVYDTSLSLIATFTSVSTSYNFIPNVNTTFYAALYSPTDNEYSNTTSASETKYYNDRLIVNNNHDGTFTLSNPPILNGSDKLMLHNTTTTTPDIDLSGNYELTYLLVDDYYNIYLISNGSKYTNITSAAFAKFYDSRLDISNNYDGTYTVIGDLDLEVGDTITLQGGGTTEVLSIPYTFTPLVDISYTVYIGCTEPYENTRSESIMEHYDSVLTWTNHYDGTYSLDNYIVESIDEIELVTTSGTSIILPNHILTMLPNDTVYAHVKHISTSSSYTHTRSIPFSSNHTTVLTTDISENGTSFAIGLVNDGYAYSYSLDNHVFANDDNMVIKYSTDADSFEVESTIDSPIWGDDISNNAFVRIVVSENSIDTNDFNLTSVSSTNTNFTSTVLNSYRYFTQTLTYAAFSVLPKVTITFKSSRDKRSNVTTYIEYIHDGIIIAANYGTHYIRPNVGQYLGNHVNNFIVNNELSLSMVGGAGNTTLVSAYIGGLGDISLNTYINMATTKNSTFNINAAKALFVSGPDDHSVYNNSMTIDISHGNGQSVTLSNGIINLGFFTGSIDILYYDIFNNIVSESPNTLRLIVLPRADITYSITDISLNHLSLGGNGYLTQGVFNTQRDDNNNPVLFNTTNLVGLVSSNIDSIVDLSNIYSRYTRLTWQSRSVDISNNLFSIYLGTNTLPDNVLNTIEYGTDRYDIIEFAGIDINNVTGIHYIDFVGTVVYTREKGIASISNVSLTDNADFTLSFIDDDDLIYDGVINTNTLNIADSTTLNNVMVTKYITTSSNVNLYTNAPSYVYVIIENSKLSSIQVQINSSIVNNIILPFATRGVFLRSGAQTWTHLYSETTASYDPSRA